MYAWNGKHPDKHIVSHLLAMHHGAVSHDDIVADLHIVSRMYYAVILDVRGDSRGTAGPGRDDLHGLRHGCRPALWRDSPCTADVSVS